MIFLLCIYAFIHSKGCDYMALTEAQKRATAKYEKEKVDRINCRLPKPLKDEIEKTGMSVNAFIIEAVKEKLSRDSMN